VFDFGGDYFPIHGWRSANFDEFALMGKIWDQLHHAFLPVLCYMIGHFAFMTVLMKNSLLENLSQDYVRTAFAKGLTERRVIFYHAVRNSLIPLATGIGGIIGAFLAGSYLIEKTFGIDGIGLLGFNALLDKDYDIMMGFLVITVLIRLIGNLISDLTYALIDPRIRFK
jgi:microcin C transport system permease protein